MRLTAPHAMKTPGMTNDRQTEIERGRKARTPNTKSTTNKTNTHQGVFRRMLRSGGMTISHLPGAYDGTVEYRKRDIGTYQYQCQARGQGLAIISSKSHASASGRVDPVSLGTCRARVTTRLQGAKGALQEHGFQPR